jgi:hypothetical protein
MGPWTRMRWRLRRRWLGEYVLLIVALAVGVLLALEVSFYFLRSGL